MKNGFLEGLGGAGEPSGRLAGERPLMNEAKAAGVKAVASAGGGRPVSLEINVRNHLMMAKIPRAEPRVLRRFPNCSATETIAIETSQIGVCHHPQPRYSPKNELWVAM